MPPLKPIKFEFGKWIYKANDNILCFFVYLKLSNNEK